MPASKIQAAQATNAYFLSRNIGGAGSDMRAIRAFSAVAAQAHAR
jgi:hypothetical protein